MKIAVLGDTHSQVGWTNQLIWDASYYEADAIVQVGDFGYWEHYDPGKFLENVSATSVSAGVPFYWIDGNHENHKMLREKYNPEGFTEIRKNVYYIPRGHKWEWDGVSFLACGGAYSIDRDWRLKKERDAFSEVDRYQRNGWTLRGELKVVAEFKERQEHFLWWPEEQISDEDLQKVVSQGQADVLFTHDCPSNAPFLHRIKDDPESNMHRAKINQIGRSVKPKLWFHGHMHEYYDYDFRTGPQTHARVIGLQCDGRKHPWAIFDTANLDEVKVPVVL